VFDSDDKQTVTERARVQSAFAVMYDRWADHAFGLATRVCDDHIAACDLATRAWGDVWQAWSREHATAEHGCDDAWMELRLRWAVLTHATRPLRQHAPAR
jgi:hypothetical protein